MRLNVSYTKEPLIKRVSKNVCGKLALYSTSFFVGLFLWAPGRITIYCRVKEYNLVCDSRDGLPVCDTSSLVPLPALFKMDAV